MQEIIKLQEIVGKSKPTARFDKAPIFREVSNEIIAGKTAKQLVTIIDQPAKFQTFAARIGRSILMPFDKVNELEHEVNKNHVSCGLSIMRQLFAAGIIERRLEAEVIGKDKDGNKIYKLLTTKDGLTFKVKHWNIYVKDKDFVTQLFYQLPIDAMDRTLPSVFQPKRRVKFFDYEGGPLVSNLNRKYIKKFAKKNLPLIYKQINNLQATEWTINKKVFEAIQANKNKDKFSFDKKKQNLDKLVEKGFITKEDKSDAVIGWNRDLNCTLALAEDLLHKTFYFYWFLDTRGRYYCASTYLSPQGSKVSKSLLYLKNKKKLGKRGLRMLKIQIANAAGHDKLPIEDRVEWTQKHISDVLSVGNAPNDTYPIWSKMDDPTGFVAACIELAEAMKLENPEDFMSGLLVSLDATTSGLQIMAMLTRCEKVGLLTNLTKSDEVGDIYKHIASKIWDDLSEYWQIHKDQRRSIVKRMIMTIFYSAGVDTISSACYDDHKAELIGLTEELCKELGEAVMGGCRKYLPGAFDVMKLLIKMGTTLADRGKLVYVKGIANDFPFIQACFLPETERITYKEKGSGNIKLTYISKKSSTIDRRGVTTGSAPNIIHHLDSQIVARVLEMTNYKVIPTHDCFAATPADADYLFDDARAAFYELFGERDVLQEIADSFSVKNTISYGNLDTQGVIYNQYMIS